MSAFVVSKKHIDLLVQTAYQGPRDRDPSHHWDGYTLARYSGYQNEDEMGAALVAENLKSIHARYPDTVRHPEATPGPVKRYWENDYRFSPQPDTLTCAEALKAIHCYNYQTCEHSEWKTSRVKEFMTRLEHSVACALPGYEDAEWGIH